MSKYTCNFLYESDWRSGNGVRLIVKRLLKNVIQASIINGPFHNETVLIPRIPIISDDNIIPVKFKRL